MSDAEKDELAHEESLKNYSRLLDAYHVFFLEIKKLERDRAKHLDDTGMIKLIREIDRERNQTHQALIGAGVLINKTESDVLVDILRKQGNLAEFGLPEFAVVSSVDFESNETSATEPRINIRDGSFQMRARTVPLTPYYNREVHSDGFLVFDIQQTWTNNPYGANWNISSNDSLERQKRMHAFAEKHGLKTGTLNETRYHGMNPTFYGIWIPATELESLANDIRSNSPLYRLGEQFYSAEQIAANEKHFKSELREEWASIVADDSLAENDSEKFIEMIARFNGPRAAKVAFDTMQEILGEKAQREWERENPQMAYPEDRYPHNEHGALGEALERSFKKHPKGGLR